MSVKNTAWATLLHFELFSLGTILFIFFFQTGLFGGIKVFFYRGIALLGLASFLTTLAATIVKFSSKKKVFTVRDILLSVVFVFCLNLVFFTHLPVTADRSVSVFLLGYINSKPDRVLTKKELTKVFVDKYVYKNQALDRRLREQTVSGNIIKEGGGYRISKQGRLVMRFYNFIARLFGIDNKTLSAKSNFSF